MIDCTIKYADLDDIERHNKAYVTAADDAAHYRASVVLLSFLDAHPTLIAYLVAAGRLQFCARHNLPLPPVNQEQPR